MAHTTSFRPARGSRGGRTALVLAGLVLVLTVGTFALVSCQGASAPVPAPSAPVAGVAPVVAPLGASAPLEIEVPAIGARSSLVPTGLNADRSLTVPPLQEPMQASWYTGSPTPGAQGPAVVLGHINGRGESGVFERLGQLKGGNQVLVDRADGQRAVFVIDRVQTFPKNAFPAQEVFGDTAGAEIRLISCGGDLDVARHSYDSNVIVFGHLVSVTRS